MPRFHGRRAAATFKRHLFSLSATRNKVPVLHGSPPIKENAQDDVLTLQLLSWGGGASGQLGGGVEETRLYPAAVANLEVFPSSFALSPASGQLRQINPCSAREETAGVSISCGLFHSALVVDGKLWLWGKGDGGRLGFGHENSAFVPTLNSHLEGVRRIALGGMHSVALTSSGEVYTWGYGGFGALGHAVYHRELLPRLVEGNWNGKVCHIATGGAHTAVITESGEVYTWGRDEGEGRLGLGCKKGQNEVGGLSFPSKVQCPIPMAAVSCGGFFTMALTEEGKIWNWGANSNYELGRCHNVSDWKPTEILVDEDVRIIQIACGGYHSLALTEEGKVLSWGFGGSGQLGHSSVLNQKVPKVIEALNEHQVTYIACGGSSSAAITAEGKLFVWGNSKECQLGIPGLPVVQSSPAQVQFLMEDDGLGDPRALSVAIGASHAMCLNLRSDRSPSSFSLEPCSS